MLAHAAVGHAHVLGLDHDGDAVRRRLRFEQVGDLDRHLLLDLGPRSDPFGKPVELR